MARSSTTFKPGQSGNPAGKPKVLGEVQALYRQQSAGNLKALVKIRDNPKSPANAVVAAATAIEDRAWGRPTQTVNASMERRPLEQLTNEELMAIAAGMDDTTAKTH